MATAKNIPYKSLIFKNKILQMSFVKNQDVNTMLTRSSGVRIWSIILSLKIFHEMVGFLPLKIPLLWAKNGDFHLPFAVQVFAVKLFAVCRFADGK